MIDMNSPLREKIFSYFFTNPHSKLYLRETARLLRVDPGNLSKEMITLEKEKIFKSEKRGSLKIYSLNAKHPLYPEFKRIIEKTLGVEGQMKENLKNIEGIEIAFIFGSFAAKKQDIWSDIDLFIVGNPDEDTLVGKISKIENFLSREINYNIFSPREFRKRTIEKEVFLKEIMKKPKIFIVGNKNELEKISGG